MRLLKQPDLQKGIKMTTDEMPVDGSLLIELASSPDLRELNKEFNGFNIFESLGMVRQEIKHSNALATILNPSSGLGLGDDVFRNFMRSIFRANKLSLPGGINTLEHIDFEIADYQDLIIKREYKNIDLLMQSPSNKHIFIFENKVGAAESDGQLESYRTTIFKEYPGYKMLFVFLTTDGSEATEDWIAVTYDEVVKAIDDSLKEASNITAEHKIFLEHYLDLLKRHVVTDQKLIDLANKIYTEHKAALDYIFENKNDEIQIFHDSLIDALDKNSFFRDGYGFAKSSKNCIRLYDREWYGGRYPFLKNESDVKWNKGIDEALLWEIVIFSNKVYLKLVLGPMTTPELRDKFKLALHKFHPSKSSKYTTMLSKTIRTLKEESLLDLEVYDVVKDVELHIDKTKTHIQKALQEFENE
jgi:hypothetical protein